MAWTPGSQEERKEKMRLRRFNDFNKLEASLVFHRLWKTSAATPPATRFSG
jgi:hypothetical protein